MKEDSLWIFEDQYAGTLKLCGKSPRIVLQNYCGTKSIKLMYEDDVCGKSHHCGYICRGYWYRVYELHQWEGRSTK